MDIPSKYGSGKTAVIYYFTGTGNAWRLAQTVNIELEKNGYQSFVSPIEDGKIHSAHNNADYIGIVSGVYGFGLPQLVCKFLRKLPRGNEKKSFIIASTGNTESFLVGKRRFTIPPTEGISIIQAGFWLKIRGYALLQGCAVEMPNNWIAVANPPNEERINQIYLNSEGTIKEFADAILNDAKKIKTLGLGLIIPLGVIYYIFLFIGRRIMGKCFTVNEKCNSCMYCYEHCPSKTIKWPDNVPYWGWNCQQCFRCINLCPENAIEVSTISVLFAFLPIILARWWFHIFISLFLVYLAHYLQFNHITRRFMPRWYLTKKRIRYKADNFSLV